MANASKKHFGAAGGLGKGDGSGARSVRPDSLPDNRVLSNRDKASGKGERGQDGKWIETEQRFDSEANRRSED